MKNLARFYTSTLSALKAVLRPAIALCACALIIFSASTPAMAAFGGGSSNSRSSEGVAQLDKVQERSEEAISKSEPAENSQEMINRANKGLNSIQGRSNRSKMVDRSDASGAETVESSIEDALEEVTP